MGQVSMELTLTPKVPLLQILELQRLVSLQEYPQNGDLR
jgi:hypothetical protein